MNKYFLINKLLYESQNDPISKLMNLMKPIKWGWRGLDRKLHQKVKDSEKGGNNWWKTYYVMSPKEVWRYKIGTCIDQSIFEQQWLKKNASNIKTTLVWIQCYDADDHMWLVFERDNKLYWFEHSWGDEKGIHGPYQNIKNIVKDVYSRSKVKKGYQYKVIGEFRWKPNITASKFLKMMDYNYNKEDWSDDSPSKH